MSLETVEVEVDKDDVAKASSSWSGFIYQGKVAIYTVLKYLNHYHSNLEEMKRYELEIEYLEDFSIIKDREYISLHQVKAKLDSKTIGSYNEAILNLLGKLAKYNSIENVNLHTVVELKPFEKDDLRTGLLNFDVSKKKKELTNYKQLISDDNQFDELYNKLKISSNTGELKIERVIAIDQIKQMIIMEIDKFYSRCRDEKLRDKYNAVENKEYIYSNFINLIEEYIHKDHLKRLSERKISIKFDTFLDILKNRNVFSINKKTYSSLLIHMIVDDFNDYCADYGIDDENINVHETWRRHVEGLKTFASEEFHLLCRKLTPYKIIENPNKIDIDQFRNIMQPDGVRDSFIHALISFANIIEPPIDAETAYIIQNESEFYTLSTINRRGHRAHESIGELIYKNLNENDEVLKMLFEIDGYINSTIDNEFTGDITRVQSDDSSEVITEKDKRNTITDSKTIKFLKIDNLKGEISND